MFVPPPHFFPLYIPYAPCMEYLPTFTINKLKPNVDKYTIHGSYGYWNLHVLLFRGFFPKSIPSPSELRQGKEIGTIFCNSKPGAGNKKNTHLYPPWNGYIRVFFSKNNGENRNQIIHLFIGFGTIIFTIHFEFFPRFLETSIHHPYIFGNILLFNRPLEKEVPIGNLPFLGPTVCWF